VTAASHWGGPAERKTVRPALPGSWEELLHQQELAAFLLEPIDLPGRRLERAIGVVYVPEFDAVIHLDETHALQPLERTSAWETGELPETYPFGV
jgi:erythromycin esterase-like protein